MNSTCPLDKCPAFLRNSEGKFYLGTWRSKERETKKHWAQITPELLRICGVVEDSRIEHEKNPLNSENLKRWGVAMKDLADIWPIPTDSVMHWLDEAETKLKDCLQINRGDYEASYELGMVHYYMMRSGNDSIAQAANYVLAEACFRPVKSQAPEFL